MQTRIALPFLALAAAAPAQTSKVIPGHLAAIEGVSNHRSPWTYGVVRHQQILDGPTVAPTAAVINGMAWRRDVLVGTDFVARSWSYDITLSDTPVSPVTMTSTFATNRGPNPGTLVFQGVVNVPAALAAYPAPHPFSVVVPFTTPFVFVTANGHLLMEIVGNDPANQSLNWSPDAEIVDTTATGRLQVIGPACTGSGQERITASIAQANAIVGGTLSVTLTTTPAGLSPVIGLLGSSNSSFSGIPLPLDLGPIGAPGCFLGTNVFDLQAGGSPLGWAIPADPNLAYGHLYTQFAAYAPSANALGLVFSFTYIVRVGSTSPAPALTQTVFRSGDIANPVGLMSVAGTYNGVVVRLDGTFN